MESIPKGKEKEVKAKQKVTTLKAREKDGGGEYVENEQAVYDWFDEQGYPLYLLPDRDQATIVGISMNPKQGLSVALKSVLADIEKEKDEAATQRRTAAIDNDYQTWSGGFGDTLADAVFEQAYYTYTHGTQPNPTLSNTYTQTQVNEAMEAWEGAAGDNQKLTDNIVNVHGFRRQDKEAKGKGNEGDTLGRRRIQANFISTWRGRTINVHVNIEG